MSINNIISKGVFHMKKIGLFIISTLLCALLCSCSSDYDKYIDEVKTGYLGGCFDDTISEVFEQTMPKGKWDGGETDDGKIIVEYKMESENDKVQIQFTIEDDNNFNVSAIKGDSVHPKNAAEAGEILYDMFAQYYFSKYPDLEIEEVIPPEPVENLLRGISKEYMQKAKNPIDMANYLNDSKDAVKSAVPVNDSDDGLNDTGLFIMFNEDDSAIDSVQIDNSRIYSLFGIQPYQSFDEATEKISDRFVEVLERENQDNTTSVSFIRDNSEDSFVIGYDNGSGCITDLCYIRNGLEGYRAEQERLKQETEEKAAAEAKVKQEAANYVNSAAEAEQYVKAYYLRQMNIEDPEGYLDRYTTFTARDRGVYYEVCASFNGNFDVDFSLYQIQKNDKNDIIKINM